MKKIVWLSLLLPLTLVSCVKNDITTPSDSIPSSDFNSSTPSSPDTPDSTIPSSSPIVPDQPTYVNDLSMKISAHSENISIDITGGSQLPNHELKVVSLPAYEYLQGDTLTGVSTSIVEIKDATVVGTYEPGSDEGITISRNSECTKTIYDQTKDEFISTTVTSDNLYNKYYIVNETKIFLGPVYCTDIDPIVTESPTLDIKSKKGAFAEDERAYDDLGCSYATINFDVSNFIEPNEYYVDDFSGDLVGRMHSADEISFVSNGKTFYFDSDVIKRYDEQVMKYYQKGASITACIVPTPVKDFMNDFPSSLTYEYANQGTTNMGLNTSNELGFEYYVALIEFIVDRYSSNSYEKGYINNFVVGNEVDYASFYNRISEKQVSLDVYMEEYSRLLRLTDLAARKYQKDIKVAMPLTHNWAKPGYSYDNDSVAAYAPKDMVDWLNDRTKKTGDFDWGIAPHSYGTHLAQAYVYGIDTSYDYQNSGMNGGRESGMTNDIDTTSMITFSNLELLDSYLNNSSMRFDNNGRKMYLTESGVSSCYETEKEKRAQAAYVAAIWYKVSQLPSVVSWNYYRMKDHSAEAVSYALFGLKDIDGAKKPAYNVYKYIDTQYGQKVANDYLSDLEYYESNGTRHSVSDKNATSFDDFLDVFDTGYDFSGFSWTSASPRTIDAVYEFEDKEDLGNLSFLSHNYLYDGQAKSLAVANLKDGLTVTYENNEKTEVGTYEVTATIKRDGVEVGKRKATLAITSKISTDKTEFAYGEDIYVTSKSSSSATKDWIGIFDKDAKIGNSSIPDTSYYYYYPDKGDGFIRSTKIQQDSYWNKPNGYSKTLAPGDYKIVYLENDGYNILESIDITILGAKETSAYPNLNAITFNDSQKAINLETTSVSLEVSGDLPSGVTVSYQNNTLSEVGKTNAVAIFKLGDVEIGRRYAVLEAYSDLIKLKTDKESYSAGETVLVTANGTNEGQWVGLYLEDDDVTQTTSIYWYYTKDHLGQAVDIKNTYYNYQRARYSDLPSGNYKVILFADSGYTIDETVNFTVTGTISARLTSDKASYKVGDSINVTLHTKSSSDWVGVFAGDCTTYGDSTLIAYYSPSTQGSSIDQVAVDITTRAASGTFKAGTYKIVAFANSEYTYDYEEIIITIEA